MNAEDRDPLTAPAVLASVRDRVVASIVVVLAVAAMVALGTATGQTVPGSGPTVPQPAQSDQLLTPTAASTDQASTGTESGSVACVQALDLHERALYQFAEAGPTNRAAWQAYYDGDDAKARRLTQAYVRQVDRSLATLSEYQGVSTRCRRDAEGAQ